MITLEQAGADLRRLIEGDFSVEVVVKNPDGTSATLRGQVNDIGHQIDPETGLAVSGRQSTITLSIAALNEAALGIPRGVSDRNSRPWLVSFATPTTAAQTWKITETRPDALGAIVCFLEAYKT